VIPRGFGLLLLPVALAAVLLTVVPARAQPRSFSLEVV